MGTNVAHWTGSDFVVIDIACEVNDFSQASSSRRCLALLRILFSEFPLVLTLILPRLKLARFAMGSCGPLITHKKLINILHVHCNSNRADT